MHFARRTICVWDVGKLDADRHCDCDLCDRGNDFGTFDVGKVAAPGERLHQWNQRWNSDSFAILLALHAVRTADHHVEVCAALARAALMESFKFWSERDVVPLSGGRGIVEHSVG